MLMAAAPPVAYSQTAAAPAAATRDFDIAPGTLASALIRFGEQAGVQFTVPAALTANKQAPAVKGRYTPEQGLRELLSGSGLTFRFANPHTVVIEAAPQGDRVLGPVRIEGTLAAAGGGSTGAGWGAGPNGSSDATATEGLNSFAAAALTAGNKTAHAIKDTPQSVSVVTRKQIDEQHLDSIVEVMNQTPGVTVAGPSNPLEPVFYSRGFTIDKATLDGGAAIDLTPGTTSYSVGGDLAAVYDHVEVLRGPDGIFAGYGAPGGSVNLVRKKPLDHQQIVFDASAGSWNNHRTALDVTAPLGLDGRLRGRAVLAAQQQDQFYDTAKNGSRTLYAILEFDATQTTLLTLGGSTERLRSTPFMFGLPAGTKGEDLGLPRSTSFVPSWNRNDVDKHEVFAQVEQRLGEDWSIKANLTHRQQDLSYQYGYSIGAVDATSRVAFLSSKAADAPTVQNLGELSVGGKFEAFGRRHELVLGGSYSKSDSAGTRYYSLTPGFLVYDPYSFDPVTSYPEPASSLSETQPVSNATQKGAYAKVNLQLTDSLHLLTGLRYLGTETNSVSVFTGSTPTSVSNVKGHHSSVPFAALTYELNKSLTAYVSYAEGYEDQSAYVRADGSGVGPWTGAGYELGLKYQSEDKKLNASLAVYQTTRYGVAVFDGPITSSSSGRLCCAIDGTQNDKSQGFELEASGRVLPGLDLTAGYTYNDNKTTIDGSPTTPLSYVTPRHLLKLWASFQPQSEGWNKLSFGAGVNAQSENHVNLFGGYQWGQGSYAVTGMRVGYRIDPRWSVALNMDNVFDRTYYKTASDNNFGNWYGDPRNFKLSLRGQF